MAITTEPFLKYLEKEMTIMGVLSAFAVAAPALVLNKFAGSGKESPLHDIWDLQQGALLVGCLLSLGGALLFYRERSHLAWLYGQLSLSEARGEASGVRKDWLREADGWSTWIYYRCAFVSLFLAFFFYMSAFFAVRYPEYGRYETAVLAAASVVGVALAGFYRVVLSRYSDCEQPFRRALLRSAPPNCDCAGHCYSDQT